MEPVRSRQDNNSSASGLTPWRAVGKSFVVDQSPEKHDPGQKPGENSI